MLLTPNDPRLHDVFRVRTEVFHRKLQWTGLDAHGVEREPRDAHALHFAQYRDGELASFVRVIADPDWYMLGHDLRRDYEIELARRGAALGAVEFSRWYGRHEMANAALYREVGRWMCEEGLRWGIGTVTSRALTALGQLGFRLKPSGDPDRVGVLVDTATSAAFFPWGVGAGEPLAAR